MSLSYYLARNDKSVAIFELVNKVEALTAELAAANKRLEVSPDHPFDGIECRDTTIRGLESVIDILKTDFLAAKKDAESLRSFSVAMIRESWKSDGVDGEFLQTEAVKCGLLKEETMQKACGENCGCAEYGEFPLNCYRLTPLAKGGAAIAAQEPK